MMERMTYFLVKVYVSSAVFAEGVKRASNLR